MAVTDLSTVSAALSLVYQSPLQSQIRWDSTLIHLLAIVLGSGKSANITAEFSGQSNGAAAAETATYALSDADNEDEVPGTLPWAKYEKTAAVTGLSEAAAATNPFNVSLLGENAGLLAKRAADAYARNLRGIAVACFSGQSGQSPGQVVGIATSVDATGSYAGIDPNTYTEWASSEQTGSLASLSFSMIDTKLITPVFDASGTTPTVLVTTSAIFDAIRALYASNAVPWIREFEVPDGRGGNRVVTLQAGANAISYQGIPIVRDRDCTSGTIYALNLNYLKLSQLPNKALTRFANPAEIAMALRSIAGAGAARYSDKAIEEMADMIRNPRGVMPWFKLLAATGDQDQVLTTAYVQLINDRRNAHGKLTLS